MSFVATFLIASVLTPTNNTNADDNTSSSASADGYTMTLSATSAVNLALSVSDDDTMTVGQGTVSVQTTSPGYRLYISMTGDTTGLSGIADGISGNIPATSGSLTSPISLTRGTWGYAIPSSGVAHLVTPNGFSSTYEEMSSTTPDTSKLFAVPPTSSSNPQMIASSTSSTSGDNYPIYYAVRANSATAPGEYSNKVLFTAVADAGTTETMTLTPSSVNINTATTVTVKTSLYSTAGYANANIYFLTTAEKNSISGTNVEALGKTPLTCSKTSNTPVTYSCTLPAQTTPGTYYVYAKFPTYDKAYATTFTVINPVFYTITTMQQMTPEICASVPTPSADATSVPTTTLLDARGTTQYSYTIKKLADGNCWMTDNLRLKNTTITSADSNVVANFTIPDSKTGTTYDTAQVWDTGDATYGVLYSWYAATAGAGLQAVTSGNVSTSICPKGWKLPSGGNDGMFQNLYSYYNSPEAMMSSDGPAFVLGGRWHPNDGGNAQGSYGGYQSSTAKASTTSYRMFINDTIVRPGDEGYDDKRYGWAVRCVAESFWNIDTMQQMTPTIISSLATPSTSASTAVTTQAQYEAASDKTAVVPTRTLTDVRDGNTYTVKKLADGNIWMGQNLRLGASIQINSTTSDFSGTTFNMPSHSTGSWGSPTNSTNVNTLRAYITGDTTYGNYYNWYTATAKSGTYSTTSGDALYSICPKGWKLPTSSDLSTLYYDNYHGYEAIQGVPAFAKGGYYYAQDGFFEHQGTAVMYNSSTATRNSEAIGMDIRPTQENISARYKLHGTPIRCVAAGDFWSISTMQEMTNSVIASVTTPANSATTSVTTREEYVAIADKTTVVPTRTLVDTRDGKTYTVKKLSDGKIWMTTDLNVSGGLTLTPNNSNVTASYVLPTSSISGFNSASVASVYNSTDYGGYYNYNAATAGTNPSSGTATQDICPRGWRLPITSEWTTILGKFSTVALMISEPFNSVMAGWVQNDTVNSSGDKVTYWAANAQQSGRAYLAYVYRDTNTKGTNNNTSIVGIKVRCVAR